MTKRNKIIWKQLFFIILTVLLALFSGIIFQKKFPQDEVVLDEISIYPLSGMNFPDNWEKNQSDMMAFFEEYLRSIIENDSGYQKGVSHLDYQAIENIKNIEIYSCMIPDTEDFLTYIYYDKKLFGIEQVIPVEEQYYMKQTEAGEIVIGDEIDEKYKAAASRAEESETIKQLRENQQNRISALNGKPEFSAYLDNVIRQTGVCMEITGNDVKVRQTPSTDSLELDKYYKGDEVVVFGNVDDGWTMIQYEQGVAYTYGSYVAVPEMGKNEVESETQSEIHNNSQNNNESENSSLGLTDASDQENSAETESTDQGEMIIDGGQGDVEYPE